ncbi:MAG: phenylacetate--CoA ligase family protein [Oligoflexia bacterium]|nr:phenylacetate--CoA ligase family protein [Oligoflexia bacterium]
MVYDFLELVQFASKHSKYYHDIYNEKKILDKIESGNFLISDLPIVKQADFWKYNSIKDNNLLTADIAASGGIVFKSGGTTGNPKFSVYTKDEWETFTAEFSKGIDQIGLDDGDRVANIFYSGSLYASFVFIMKSLEKSKINILHFPITGQCSAHDTIKIIKEFSINVIVGVPTTILTLLEFANEINEIRNMPITKIFFGGESMFLDQRERIKSFFPKIYISSIGYASVDGGHLGFVAKNMAYNEHFCFNESSIMEIIDEESGMPIETTGKSGKLVYSNLTRKLMPIIRYPVGDNAVWISVNKKFKLLGRSEEGARVGPVTVNIDDINNVIKTVSSNYSNTNYNINIINKQLLLEHISGKDLLTVRLAVSDLSSINLKEINAIEQIFTEVFYKERPMFKEEVAKGTIMNITFKIVSFDQIEKNERTGKLKIILDRRL